MPLTGELRLLLDRFADDAGGVVPLAALWAHGSLALGDFQPGRSDLDLVALTEAAPAGALGVLARLGAPASVVRDIYQRRYESPPPITEHWRTERGNQARTYLREGLRQLLALA